MSLLLTAVTLFLAGGIMLLTGLTIVRYVRLWRLTPGSRGLLPLHVWMVASSYFLLVLLLVLGGVSGQTDLGDWRAAVRIPALGFGFTAMFVLYNFQRKTYRLTEDERRA